MAPVGTVAGGAAARAAAARRGRDVRIRPLRLVADQEAQQFGEQLARTLAPFVEFVGGVARRTGLAARIVFGTGGTAARGVAARGSEAVAVFAEREAVDDDAH